jgi:hypothetical protein
MAALGKGVVGIFPDEMRLLVATSLRRAMRRACVG